MLGYEQEIRTDQKYKLHVMKSYVISYEIIKWITKIICTKESKTKIKGQSKILIFKYKIETHRWFNSENRRALLT